MAMENHTTKEKENKACQMMATPFRLPDIVYAVGIGQADDEPESEKEGGAKNDDNSDDEQDLHATMMVGDTTNVNDMKNIKKEFKKVASDFEQDGMEFRAIVVTSPPWGVLDAHRKEIGGEDEPLSPDMIRGLAISLADLLDDKAVVCIHLPPLDQGAWRTLFESTGKWQAYHSPVVIMPSNTRGLTFFNKYQLATNIFSFLCFHKPDQHPLVTADFLRDRPGMVKLMNSLWNAGTIIPSTAVPKCERVTVKVDKKRTYVRTQQLPTAVIRPLIRIFGRAIKEQDEVFVVDPFMGTGSIAVAAHQLGCGFFGWDRDASVVIHANSKFRQLKQVNPRIMNPYIL